MFNHTTGKSTEKQVYQNGNITIVRGVSRYAYARSGNADNPTPEYYWIVKRDGVCSGIYCTFKAAKDLAGCFK